MSDSRPSPLAKSDPFLNPGDFQEDLGMFEAATHAAPVEIPTISLARIVFAPDGSNQDATARLVAQQFAGRFGAELVEVAELRTAAALQAARQQHGADLLAFAVPFGADYGELRSESLGDVADRVLVNMLPILAVRKPLDEATAQACFRHVVVPLSPENPRSSDALAWAARLLDGVGQLTVVEIADADLRAEAGQLREQAEPVGLTASERVNRVLTRYFAGSIGAIQKRSVESGFQLQVLGTAGRFVASTLAQLQGAPGLVILAGSADRSSDSYHHEADLILQSEYPVLIV